MRPSVDLVLVCQTCRHAFPSATSTGTVAAHVEIEHPLQRNEKGGLDVRLAMVAWCSRCDAEVPRVDTIARGKGREEHVYVCPECSRSLIVSQRR